MRSRWEGRSALPLSADAQLFFIVGKAKSGTTWLENLLDSHPEVLCRGEGRFFGNPRGAPAPGGPGAVSLAEGLLADETLKDWAQRSVWTRDARFERVAEQAAAGMAERIIRVELARSRKLVAGDKTPLRDTGTVQQISQVLPEAKIIHVVRDGRDVAISSIHHIWNQAERDALTPALRDRQVAIRDAYRANPDGFVDSGRSLFAPGHLQVIARSWAEITRAATKQGRALPAGRYIEVRYEDLLASGSRELARICEFLEVDASESIVERCLSENSFERLTGGRERGVEDPRAFFRLGVAGDWRRIFNAGDHAAFGAGRGRGPDRARLRVGRRSLGKPQRP